MLLSHGEPCGLMALKGIAFAIDDVVQSYHVYKDIWNADIGSEFPCHPETTNHEDRYAVVVMSHE